MSAIRKGVQRQLFQTDDERLHAIVHVVRVDGPLSTFQPVSAKEEADFRRLLAKAELTIGEADKFAESMMGSEMAVNQLLALLDGALDKVALLEKEIDTCDAILAVCGNN
ncbi:hypothetical protein TELCIR_05072 [Teladorsagia circumcincta]|uniref:Uncharacterized protein n=1 Tax=Teladorsagia circumcincta TaxID=45464 RepID=A0A2G9URT7_TELCI|nr:hypothetical protein TELCIR_05072 [Teladorsagia circumcincta]